MTPQDFIANFPEFRETDRTLVAAKLNQAATRMGGPDVSIWGGFATPSPATPVYNPAQGGGPTPMTKADMAQGYYAAHLLITSPFGTGLNLQIKGDGRTQYLALFEELEQAVAGGFGVAGVVV